MLAWLVPVWKYRKAILWGLLAAAVVATHAWAYSAGKRAEENRLMRERLDAFETSYAASLGEIKALFGELAGIETDTETVTREIIRYVPDDRACDLGPDAVRLLNDARGATVPAAR